MIGLESRGNLSYFNRDLARFSFPVQVLPNWASSGKLDTGPETYRQQLDLESKIVFFYGGNIGAAQDVDNIVRLASNVSEHKNVFFLLVGDGSEVGRLKRKISELGLTNIRICPAVSQSEYLSMLREFDVGLISLHRELTTHNIPGKLLGYMKCGKPVVASINRNNELRDLLEETKVGLCCENGEDAELQHACLLLATDAQLRETMGKNSRRLLERKFSDCAAANQILSAISALKRHNSLQSQIEVGANRR